jgi:hypothetical protein
VGAGTGLDRCGKSRPTGIRSPDLPARSESLYRLRYPGSDVAITRFECIYKLSAGRNVGASYVQAKVFREAHIKLVDLIRRHANLKEINFKKSFVQGVHHLYKQNFNFMTFPYRILWYGSSTPK